MNPTLFWLVTVLIVIGSVLIFVLPVLFGKDSNEQASRDELNKALFFDRMSELKQEAKEGLIDDEGALTTELQQSLLDDIPKDTVALKKSNSTQFAKLIPGIIILLALSYGLYYKMGAYQKVVDWQSVTARLPDLSRLLDSGEPLTDQEMQDLTLALRTQLEKTPNEAMGWLLLGRLGMASRDVLLTEGAMKRAFSLDPSHPDIRFGYAQTLMFSGEEAQIKKARAMLLELEAQDPNNPQLLSFLAFDAFEQKDFQQAADYWSKMKSLIAPDDPRQEMLTRSIERAKNSLKPSDSLKNIQLTINLDENVVLPAKGNLVISVHDENGSPMPVAAKLLPLTGFPVNVEITDADSMIKERLLSSLARVIVRARIDTDGNVATKAGDWSGETEAFALGQNKIVTINKQLD